VNTKQLRQKILDLAIRGKLVPQDPNDEPASVLLERIRAEKEKLIKAEKIKRDKRDSAIFRDTDKSHYGQFEIPNSWAWAQVVEIATLKSGGQYQICDSPDAYLYVKVAEMNSAENKNEITTSSMRCICKQNELIPQNSIIFPKRGGAILTNKKRLCIRQPIAIDSNTMAMIPIPEISLHYLKLWLDSFDLSSLWTGNVVPQINNQDIYPLFVPIPPFPEQRRLVAAIESAFAVIDEIERNKSDLQSAVTAAKSKILSLAIRGKLVPQDPNDEPASVLLERIRAEREKLVKAGKIKRAKGESIIIRGDDNSYYANLPGSWVVCRLGDIFNIVSARRVHQSDWRTSGIPFYRTREVVILAEKNYVKNELFISEKLYSEFALSGIPQKNDIMLTAVGTIGKSYVVKENDTFYYKDASVLCLENFSNINARFISYLFKSNYMHEQMHEHSKGTTVDTITIVKANMYFIPLPPLQEQYRIVTAIEASFEQLDNITVTLSQN